MTINEAGPPLDGLIPDPDIIRPVLALAELRVDMLRRLLALALDKSATPEQLERVRAAAGRKGKELRHAV